MFMVVIPAEQCKGCGLCVLHCKSQILSVSSTINKQGYFPAEFSKQSECSGCQNCYITCPDGIVEIYKCEDKEMLET